jgi:hypothetical protein
LLALGLAVAIWGLMLRQPDQPLPSYLRDLVFIILGHYFASRKRVETTGPSDSPPPLYLPRGSVRLLLIGGFLVVALVLGARGEFAAAPSSPSAVTLLLVGGFLLGVVLNRIREWTAGGRPRSRGFEDLKAITVLAAAALLVALVWGVSLPDPLSHVVDDLRGRLGPINPEELLATVIGFYFGTRS